MWPFNRKPPPMTTEEYAASRPPAPCGHQTTHYYWTELEGGMSCPACVVIKQAKRKDAELDALADKIVERLNRTRASEGANHD
jgi:hypothetical protein